MTIYAQGMRCTPDHVESVEIWLQHHGPEQSLSGDKVIFETKRKADLCNWEIESQRPPIG